MVPTENKAKRLSLVNRTTKTTYLKDNENRYLQADNCVKECQLNQVKPREIKDNSYKLSKNRL